MSRQAPAYDEEQLYLNLSAAIQRTVGWNLALGIPTFSLCSHPSFELGHTLRGGLTLVRCFGFLCILHIISIIFTGNFLRRASRSVTVGGVYQARSSQQFYRQWISRCLEVCYRYRVFCPIIHTFRLCKGEFSSSSRSEQLLDISR